jgi:hypothetical protein
VSGEERRVDDVSINVPYHCYDDAQRDVTASLSLFFVVVMLRCFLLLLFEQLAVL